MEYEKNEAKPKPNEISKFKDVVESFATTSLV